MSGHAVSSRAGARTAFSAAALSALSALPLQAHADAPSWWIALAARDPGTCLSAARAAPRSFALKPIAAASSSALCAGGQRALPATASGSYSDIVNDIAIVEWRTGDASSPVRAIGLQGGKGTRSILSRGSVDAKATASVDSFEPTLELIGGEDGSETLTVSATAVGIRGGGAKPSIDNPGTVSAAAEASVDKVKLTLALAGTAQATASATIAASAIGIEGGRAVGNDGTVTATAQASATSVGIGLSHDTAADFTVETALQANATGVSGSGNLSNRGSVTASADASLTRVGVTFTVIETAHATTPTAIEATAIGLDGAGSSEGGKGHEGSKSLDGGGSVDTGKAHGSLIANDGTVLAQASAGSTDVAVAASALNFATASSPLTLDAGATGIRAGRAHERIINNGSVTASADAELTQVGVSLRFADFSIADQGTSDASSTLTAKAVGIDAADAGHGVDIGGTGRVTATAQAHVSSTGVSISSEGVPSSVQSLFTGPIAEVGITALGESTGVRGGAGGDGVSLAGPVNVTADVSAKQQLIDLGIGVFDFHVPTPGFSVDGAGTRATATATGVATQGGDDSIAQAGAMVVSATSESSTVVAVAKIADLAIDTHLPLPQIPISHTVLVADAITESTATAIGIDAGEGDDRIVNASGGSMSVGATANSGTVDVTGRAGLKFEDKKTPDPSQPKPSFSAEFGVSLARASIDAKSSSTGIDGGDGRDTIVNDGVLGANATTKTYGVSVDVALTGPLDFDQGPKPSLLGSGAASDTSNHAAATAVAVQGGAGDDTLVNRGSSTASASASALNVTVGVDVKIEQNGALAGVSLVDSDAAATARAVGLDGGAGSDRIENLGQLDSTASASATSVSAVVKVQRLADKGLAASVSVLDADTTATATAVGLRSGDAAPADDDAHDKADNAGRAVLGRPSKACTSAAAHHGCTPPAPPAELRNAGTVKVDADAANVAVNVAAHVSLAKEGAAVGVALSDTSATTIAGATAMEGGEAGERIANEGRLGLTATSQAVSVGVNVAVEGAASGLAAGATLTRSAVDASATATGIAGGGGDDVILNTGTIATQSRNAQDPRSVQATATTVSVGIEPTVVTKTGAAIGAALTDTRATSSATATGIDGGDGDDQVLNRGDIQLAAIGSDTTAVGVALELALAKQGFAAGAALARADAVSQATATGIAGGAGDDTLVNEKLVSVKDVRSDSNAVTVSSDISGAKDGLVLGAALADATGSSTTTATGLAGGAGRDTLANLGTIRLENVAAESDAVDVGVTITIAKDGLGVGAALVRSGATASLDAAGLSGGDGKDTLFNERDIDIVGASAKADAVGVSVALAGSSNGVDIAAALVDGSSTATATARGIDGGAGDDVAVNRGHIGLSGVQAVGLTASIGVSLAGTNNGVSASATLADGSATATAHATGIDGGDGHDELWNLGGIVIEKTRADATAVSTSVSLSGTLSAGVAAGAALGRTTATAEAQATGLAGGAGDDRIVSKGETGLRIDDVAASTTAVAVGVQLGVVSNGLGIGAALVDTSTTARTAATGLAGGSGDDLLVNAGPLTLQNLRADAHAVGVTVSGNAALNAGLAGGVALVDGKGTAELRATGLDGGAGADRLLNEGELKIAEAGASAHATGVTVELSFSMAGVAAGAAIADTGADALTVVKGLDGGAGNDLLVNRKSVDVKGQANADAVGVSVSLSVALGAASGTSVADARSTARAEVSGIEAGEGDDSTFNEGSVMAGATAVAEGTSVAITVPNVTGGYAAARLTTTATAQAVGLSDADSTAPAPCGQGQHAASGSGALHCGGEGQGDHGHDDHGRSASIANRGAVQAEAHATATGTSVSGTLFGIALGDVGNSARADAAAVRSGARDDVIVNEDSLGARSEAHASGLAVSVSLFGSTTADASTTAIARATGIDSGAGDDVIDNRAVIVAKAGSNASANNVSVGLVGKSSAGGEATASKLAEASARGIDGGDGDDWIGNSGSVLVDAGRAALRPDGRRDGGCSVTTAGGACAVASQVSVQLAGSAGVKAGTSANAAGSGLEGGRGDDHVENSGLVQVDALAHSLGDSVGVVIFGVSTAASNLQASASASGLAGGAGTDAVLNGGGGRLQVAADAIATLRGTSFAFAGSAPTLATVSADATAVGLGGGSGADVLKNDGVADVAARARLDVSGAGTAIFGGASAGSNVTASASATGIDGGDDADGILNRGTLGVSANATLVASSTSFGFGNAHSNDVLFSVTHATGIDAGAGDNVVINDGLLTADAGSTLSASGGATTVFGNTSAAANVTARTFATGIAAGAGHDVIAIGVNGSLAVTGTLAASASSSAEPGALFVDGKAVSSAAAESTVIGIDAGEGDNRIVVEGSIAATLKGSATAGTYADADFFSLDSDAFSDSTATLRPSRAIGVQTGAGRDRIANLGTITVNAKPEVTAAANADGGGLIDDDAYATATASASGVQAIGIDAGAGDNAILNSGTISVAAAPKATASASGVAYGGSDSGAGATATISGATAIGILASGRADQVVNEGTIGVHTDAQALASASSSPGSLVGGTNEFQYSVSEVRGAQAIGIWLRGPSGGVLNSGSVDVGSFASSLGSSDAAAYGLRIDGQASLADAVTLELRGSTDTHEPPPARVTNGGFVGATSTAEVLFGTADSRARGVSIDVPSMVQNDGTILATASASGVFGDLSAESHGVWLGQGRHSVVNAGDIISRAEVSSRLFFGFVSGKAQAIGIEAGDGGSRIVNAGHIVVDAVSNGEATAVGIRTGSGDDLIINQGSIVATRTIDGVTLPGTAIDAGAGNDTVILAEGSVTRGDIDLGAGTDVLTMRGNTVIEGTVIDDGARLLLQLNGNGSFGGTVPATAIVKRGEGTFSLATLPSVQRLELQGGTLEVAGDYRFRSDGQFSATINGDGTHGLLHLLGQAQLGGSFSVQRGSGPYVNGTRYELLRAEGGFVPGASFDSIELPASTRLVSFSSARQAGTYSVTADVKSFGSVASGRDALAVAGQLDRVLPTARGDLRNTLAGVQGLATDAEFAAAYASLSPASHGQRSLAGAASARRFGQALEQRLGALQVGARADAAAALAPAGLARRVAGDALSLQGGAEPRQARPYGLWVQAFAQKGDQDSTSDVAGYRFDLAGRAIGMDHRFSETFSAGVAYGWVSNEFKSAIAGNTADIDTRLFALYGSYAGEGFYANGIFSVGHASYDSRRSIVVGATSTPVTSQHDAKVTAATLGAGWPLRLGGGWVEPFANLHYTRLKEEAFSESGSGSALAVAQRSTRSVVSELGVRWTHAYAARGNASVSPEASVAWLHDFGSGDRLINAAYLDAPDASFAVEGQPIRRNGAKLGLGLTYRSGSGLTTQLRYSAEVRPGYRAQGLMGELRYEF